MKTIFERLQEICSCVLEQESMAKHTTFKIGGPCDYMVFPKSVEEVKRILAFAKEENHSSRRVYSVLGNVLVAYVDNIIVFHTVIL